MKNVLLWVLVGSVCLMGSMSSSTDMLLSSQSTGQGASPTLTLVSSISGAIRPKSIGHSGNGRFFAQNMMYMHTVTVYDRNFEQIKTISDEIDFSHFQEQGFKGKAQGAPVEIAFSPNGQTAWVANYKMYGSAFSNPGQDNCGQSTSYDPSFVYQINTRTLTIERIIKVGSVPKYLTTTPDGRYLLVANWCSGDVSIIETSSAKEVKRLPVGTHPRGIAIDSKSRTAYVSLAGERRIAIINLGEFTMNWTDDVGDEPQHICLGPSDRFLYIALSQSGEVAKMDLVKREIVAKRQIGKDIRSIEPSPDFQYLYAVDYEQAQLIKLKTADLLVTERSATDPKPIGTTFDTETGNVWVACYSGSIQIFADGLYNQNATADAMNPASNSRFAPYRPGTASPTQQPYRYIYGETTPNMGVFSPGEPVKEEKLPSETIAVAPAPQQRLRGEVNNGYHIIVGSFQDERQAQAYLRELRKSGAEVQLIQSNQVYRISAGAFSSKEEALAQLPGIKSTLQPNAWILNP